MAVLTKAEILKELKSKNLEIKPLKKNQIGAGSIDLSLDNKFRIFDKRGVIKINEKVDYKKYTKLKKTNKIILHPGGIVLGITKEKIKLPNNLCGWLQGRTRFARLGLVVHITASFVQPGSHNQQVLEIVNIGNNTLELHAGDRICQLILERTEGKAKEKTKYTYNQKL